ncbi:MULTISPECIES: hypothetical protein [Actinomycetes]|uniref:Uncharacterized protein n=2 Tax=Actinomycetes TaxID=1760 RepID=A0ABP5ZBN5_9ACTN
MPENVQWFVDRYTWQDQRVITSEADLPRILAPLIELVGGSADQG